MPETHWPERRDVNMSTLLAQVYINYVGKLQDGKTVHSNGEEKPYKFKLGKFWQTPSAYLTIPCLGLPFRMHVLLTAGSEKVMRGWNLGITGKTTLELAVLYML